MIQRQYPEGMFQLRYATFNMTTWYRYFERPPDGVETSFRMCANGYRPRVLDDAQRDKNGQQKNIDAYKRQKENLFRLGFHLGYVVGSQKEGYVGSDKHG